MAVSGVLATHYHPDHVGGSMMGHTIEGVDAAARAGRPARSTCNEPRRRGSPAPPALAETDLVAHEPGDLVAVGDVEIELVHTPGHTPGSQCFLVDGRLVSGDTLFLDGCGRTDLPGSDPAQMYDSLQRLAGLPADDGRLPRPPLLGAVERVARAVKEPELRLPPLVPRAVADDVRRLTPGGGRERRAALCRRRCTRMGRHARQLRDDQRRHAGHGQQHEHEAAEALRVEMAAQGDAGAGADGQRRGATRRRRPAPHDRTSRSPRTRRR